MDERFSAFADAMTSDIDACSSIPATEERRFALFRLKDRYRKKYRANAGLASRALEDFLTLNGEVGLIRPSLSPDIRSNARLFIELAFERMSRKLDPDLIQVSFVRSDLVNRWRFGPGASHKVKGTHTADKIHEPMSCTPAADPLVKSLRQQHPYLRGFDAENGKPTVLVDGSKMSTVPKNEETERTIAIEPSGNMALQLAVGSYLEDVLRGVGLDIRRQQLVNRDLAMRGSLDGSLSTLDLSSASDRITPALCKQLLPPDVYRFLMRIRSPKTIINGDLHDLKMISTMGNGFTFPLMTLLILSICYAVMLRHGGRFNFVDYRFVSVFGDDIVVPRFVTDDVVSELELAGFAVNRSKSYMSGPFRESCGGDYVNGYDCTPFYVKDLSSDSSVYVAINQVFRWSAKHNFVFSATLKTLRGFLRGPLLLVPEWHGDTDGVRVRSGFPRRYKHLSVKQRYVRLRSEFFVSCLAAGGYIEWKGGSSVFLPRPSQARFVTRKSRLPNGFLDGRDSVSYRSQESDFVEAWLFLLE